MARLATAHEKYAEAKQRENQNARTFLTYLETLETQMTPYTEDQKLYHYFSRLRKDLRLAITDHNLIPATRRELCSLASQLERNLIAKKSRPLIERVIGPKKQEKRKDSASKTQKQGGSRRRGPSTTTAGTSAARTANKDLSQITCYNCDKKGHYSTTCPAPKKAPNANRTALGGKPSGKT